MFKSVYHGTSTNRISTLAEYGMEEKDLVPSKLQAFAQAKKQAAMDGGRPVLLKVILDESIQNGGKIKPNKILVCE